MEMYDVDLSKFEADGAAPLPVTHDQGYVDQDGARIWYATYGSGPPVILLHGGLGHSGNWGYQVPALVKSGYGMSFTDGVWMMWRNVPGFSQRFTGAFSK
jgi:pimeloyl-ACP methyl ester carboxylesterase